MAQKFFFLERAGELRISILRRRMGHRAPQFYSLTETGHVTRPKNKYNTIKNHL
jgi:hypothetical protein